MYWSKDRSCCKVSIEISLVLGAIFTGYWTYNRIASPVSTEDAVKDGVKVLNFKDYSGWGAFIVFIIIYIIYYFNELKQSIKSMGKTIVSTFTCAYCKLDPRLETVFDLKHLKWKPNTKFYQIPVFVF